MNTKTSGNSDAAESQSALARARALDRRAGRRTWPRL